MHALNTEIIASFYVPFMLGGCMLYDHISLFCLVMMLLIQCYLGTSHVLDCSESPGLASTELNV
jgi:hypothetical protein